MIATGQDAGGGTHGGGDDDDEFEVFSGFDKDNKPTNKPSKGGRGGGGDGAGLSWDAERKVWEKHTKANPWGGAGRSSFGGWDLRGSATFTSPASLLRIRSQAEAIFNDNISSSLFSSPSMQRFKAQTDSMFAGLNSTFSGVTSIVSDVRSTLFSWFS